MNQHLNFSHWGRLVLLGLSVMLAACGGGGGRRAQDSGRQEAVGQSAASKKYSEKNAKALLPAAISGEQIVWRSGYVLSYNEQHEQANWVAYELNKSELKGKEERSNNFMPDPEISTGSATDEDYRGSGYDRGHLAPAGDMKWSEQAMQESFYFSNMSPQHADLNRESWRVLEERVRDWAKDFGSLYIVTGGVLKGRLDKIGRKNKVSVPKLYYKVIYDHQNGQAIAFLMPNKRNDDPIEAYAVTIDEVEEATGIDFFASIDPKTAAKIESHVDLPYWFAELSAKPRSKPAAKPAEDQEAVVCRGTTKAGNACTNRTKDPSGYCVHHQSQAKN